MTAKSLKEYFSTGTGKKLWSDGKRKADEGGYGGGVFDDGRYKVKLTDSYSSVSQKGRPQNVFGFKFLEGDYKGQKVFKYQGVDNETGIAILMRDFKLFGQEVESPDDVDDANKKVAKSGAVLTIRLKTNGEYQNVILERLLDDEKGEEDVSEDDEDTDADESDDEADEETDDDDSEESESDEKEKKDEEKDEEEDEEDEEDEDSDDEAEDSEEEEDEEEKKPAKRGRPAKPAVEKEETEEVALEIGMKVKLKDGTKGKIVKILENEGKIKIKFPNGDKKKVSVEDIADLA